MPPRQRREASEIFLCDPLRFQGPLHIGIPFWSVTPSLRLILLSQKSTSNTIRSRQAAASHMCHEPRPESQEWRSTPWTSLQDLNSGAQTLEGRRMHGLIPVPGALLTCQDVSKGHSKPAWFGVRPSGQRGGRGFASRRAHETLTARLRSSTSVLASDLTCESRNPKPTNGCTSLALAFGRSSERVARHPSSACGKGFSSL